MRGTILAVGAVLISAYGVAAPIPTFTEAKTLVADLSSESRAVRDRSTAILHGRPDAGPWLRRATHSPDRDTADRASRLLAIYAENRSRSIPHNLQTSVRDSQADLFIEWHQFWKPSSAEDLWAIIARFGQPGTHAVAAQYPAGVLNPIETSLSNALLADRQSHRTLDGPFKGLATEGPWQLRTDYVNAQGQIVIAASVGGRLTMSRLWCGYHLALGDVHSDLITGSVIVCDGVFGGRPDRNDSARSPVIVSGSFIACRGSALLPHTKLDNAIILSGEYVDLHQVVEIKNCIIRASGDIRLPPNVKPVNCTIEARAKNATAPYKFFEVTDLGLSLADDEEGLVVTAVKPGSPFGDSGLARGDLIRAIDDAPAGHSEEFRKAVRRALVRQGDCLLTVTRGDTTGDFPVFFPLPK